MKVLLVLCVVGATSACKYWCKAPGATKYECCDDGNPYFNPDDNDDTVTEAVADFIPANSGDSSSCYYYCVYKGATYCCGDSSQPLPVNHDTHEGECAEEEEQKCKSQGIYYLAKGQGKTSGAIMLVSGVAKDKPSCASDGYCAKDQKCCASNCVNRHICMKALHDKEPEKEE